MKTTLQFVGLLVLELSIGVAEDVVSPDEELDLATIAIALELGQLLLKVRSLIVEVKDVRHVLNKTLEFISKHVRPALNHLVDNALVHHAEVAQLLNAERGVVAVFKQSELFLGCLNCGLGKREHLDLVLVGLFLGLLLFPLLFLNLLHSLVLNGIN